MAKLRTHVHVKDDKGLTHVFGPADELPEWAQRAITNPKAWEGGVLPTVSQLTEPTPAPVKKAPTKRAAPRRKAVSNGAAGTE